MNKKIFFLMILGSFAVAGTDLKINLNVPVYPGKTLPQYQTLNNQQNVQTPIKLNPCCKSIQNLMQNPNKTNNNQQNQNTNNNAVNNVQQGDYKVVSSDVIEKFSSKLDKKSLFNNICQAFIIDNSNKAFDYGYQEGVKYTKIYIGKFLLKHKKQLDVLFPLKQLYLNDGILQPPVIGKEDKGSYIYQDGNVYRQFGVKYYIKEPARFVPRGMYKKWEDFLLDYPVEYYETVKVGKKLHFNMDIKYSNNPECNKKTKEAVYKKFREGFVAGEKEVFLLMKIRLEKLQKFLDGLYLYNELYYRGIINPPLISEFIEPVYRNENGKKLIINEKVLKIVKPASFNTETKKWKVFLITNDKVVIPHIKIVR